MVRVEHLVSFVPTLVELVTKIGITHLIEIEHTVKANWVVALFALTEFHLLPLLLGCRIAPLGTVHHQVLRQSLDEQNRLLVLDVEGIEVPPELLLAESESNALILD